MIDKILQYLQFKGKLPQPPELMLATRASPGSDWVTWLRFSKLFYMAQQHKDRLPGDVLPELS
ncbi:MAG: hypothetical protein B6D70_11660 [gamma proteobacterium symbiont of Stewartia floridana]|nr:MAG: hypothetical protein B6D76_02945 [gamma proteobacterium symbiont of Stewartia floridana]RLW59769.1 MAG: hypothetical protein B6D70_11660 [gamma proteobacterium symbiont of Stewartia floridana]RLW61844.1 MAG: hypothetical protein B6D75_01130 [gamma proteobacterium symbiont of Stewartia floridana]RLW64620.1 MAG: hypothetical protein B6D73_10275 [gamma proteobacterium symbiont of Stewartia floridana]